MDSITLCDDEKAKAINTYARGNMLRREKLSAFHRDRQLWMEKRLGRGQSKMTEEEYVGSKKEKQEKRQLLALKRAETRRQNALIKKQAAAAAKENQDEIA